MATERPEGICPKYAQPDLILANFILKMFTLVELTHWKCSKQLMTKGCGDMK